MLQQTEQAPHAHGRSDPTDAAARTIRIGKNSALLVFQHIDCKKTVDGIPWYDGVSCDMMSICSCCEGRRNVHIACMSRSYFDRRAVTNQALEPTGRGRRAPQGIPTAAVRGDLNHQKAAV